MVNDTTAALSNAINRLSATMRRDIMPIIGRLPGYGRLIYALVTSNELGAKERGALLLAIGYQVSPIDLIPGFIPVIGQLDDLAVLLWAVRNALDSLPPERAEAYLADVQLIREQLDADAQLVQRALQDIIRRGTRAAGRGLATALGLGITAVAFLGYFTYYTVRGKRRS